MKLHGCFYFKKTSNGNLLGEFSNNHSDGMISTESADYSGTDNSSLNFDGTYHSTWQDGSVHMSILTIRRSGNIFNLQWVENNRVTFSGQGMLCDNILIGNYKEGE